MQPRLDLLADQPAVDRVHVAIHIDQAARIHLHSLSLGALQPPFRQRPQILHLFRQPFPAPGIQLRQQRRRNALYSATTGEVPAAAQQQRLVHRLLQPMMPLLHIAVFVRLAGLDLLPFQPVMPHQRLVARR